MAFEKKIEVRPIASCLINGAIDQEILTQWTNGLNSLSSWALVCVVESAGYLWAFLQREVP